MHARIQARLHYLPEYLHNEPYRVLRGAVNALRLPGCRRALRVWLRDWLRDPTRNRLRRFGQALVFAAELSPAVDYLYVHFLHTPASVTRYAAYLLNRRWAAAAHARDIWTLADWEKREKLADLDWLVTCTAANVAHLRALAWRGSDGEKAEALLQEALSLNPNHVPSLLFKAEQAIDAEVRTSNRD